MQPYLRQRFVQSAISLFGLIVIVFFLARLTGDPTDLLLPVDTPAAVRQEFSARHGFDQPVIVQFGALPRGPRCASTSASRCTRRRRRSTSCCTPCRRR